MALLSRRVVFAAALLCATPLRAQEPQNSGAKPEKRVAIRGYDPVAYYTEQRPVQGVSEFAADFDDATYWFKSAENRALFVADPDRYAPQFGGLCAMTVAHGGIADPDPEAWTIADGKLYLFRAKGIAMFQQQMASIVSKATENWPSLRKQP